MQLPKTSKYHIAAHGSSVVTCLILANDRIISASDDHSILVHSASTGERFLELKGHTGGIWSLGVADDTLVSGSTDRTVRVWDLKSGECTHIFAGHSSTVRTLAIVQPQSVDVTNEEGFINKEIWPKRSLIVTGSRDHSLRVWTLPRAGEPEYRDDPDTDDYEVAVQNNPYHRSHLIGHDHAVRDVAACGRIAVSGSYDCIVRVWDLVSGQAKWVMSGHTQKVYCVALDLPRQQAFSGSIDGTVRVWNVETGECKGTLSGHLSLVGLIAVSPSYLVSAAADSTTRVWDPETGELKHASYIHSGAITTFQHDELKVITGGDGSLKMWDISDGTLVRELLSGITGVWQVVFRGGLCVAASNVSDHTYLDVWDFGEDDEYWGTTLDEPIVEHVSDDEDEGTRKIKRYMETCK